MSDNPRKRNLSTAFNNDDDDNEDDIDKIIEDLMHAQRSTSIILENTNRNDQRNRITIKETNQNTEIIDLITPSKSPIGLCRLNYVPHTLHYVHDKRLSILPAYPTDDDDSKLNLLLCNVPPQQLSLQELDRRQMGQYQCPFRITNNQMSKKSIMIKQYEKYFIPLIERLNVDVSILDFNYMRFEHFLQLFRVARTSILPKDKAVNESWKIDDNELQLLFEFYLQIDVDLFYMKTCSFEQAQPRSLTEGLFCNDIPQCRYTITPCGNCELCHSLNDPKNRQQTSTLFNRYEKHRFVNGYESILNCPATCHTKYCIYVLTCLCGQADYISETKHSLSSRLPGHRKIGNYTILRFLIGFRNYENFEKSKDLISAPSLEKTSMLLYQHLLQCSTAIQMFLNANPLYWCFVPMLIAEADQEDINYEQQQIRRTTTAMTIGDLELDYDIKTFLNNIPKCSTDYRFSKYQIKKQIEFFKRKLIHQPINNRLDLYNANIVAVLPPNVSDLFLYVIHSLFVTHAETKLNKLGHIFHIAKRMNDRSPFWCSDLQRPSTSSFD